MVTLGNKMKFEEERTIESSRENYGKMGNVIHGSLIKYTKVMVPHLRECASHHTRSVLENHQDGKTGNVVHGSLIKYTNVMDPHLRECVSYH